MTRSTSRVLVAKHKHGDQYYLINSEDDVLRAKAQMLLDWDRYDMFYEPTSPRVSQEDREVSELSDEQIEALPEAFRLAARATARNVRAQDREYAIDATAFSNYEVFLNAETLDEAIALTAETGQNLVTWLTNHYGQEEYTYWDIMPATPPTGWIR
jgi:hypothetical protein